MYIIYTANLPLQNISMENSKYTVSGLQTVHHQHQHTIYIVSSVSYVYGSLLPIYIGEPHKSFYNVVSDTFPMSCIILYPALYSAAMFISLEKRAVLKRHIFFIEYLLCLRELNFYRLDGFYFFFSQRYLLLTQDIIVFLLK